MNLTPDRQGNLQVLERAISAISSYNDAHSTTAQMGKTLVGIFSGLFGDERAPVPTPPARSAVKDAESIFTRFQPQLSRIGLQLEFNRERADVYSLRFNFQEHLEPQNPRPGIPIDGQRLEMSVSDSDKLLGFFMSIRLAEVKSPLAQTALEAVASELDRFIVRTYIMEALGHGEGDAERLYHVAGEISGELQRLGQKQAAAILTSHLEHIWQGDLREHILAEQGHILPSDGFAPHNWHLDITPERYQSRWSSALDSLGEVAQNPRAYRIFDEARGYLSDSLEIARGFYSALEQSGQGTPHLISLVPEFQEILSSMAARLSTIQR